MRICLPEKVIFTEAASLRRMSFLRVDKSLGLPKLKSITVLLCDFSFKNLLLSLLLLKTCSTFNLRHLSMVACFKCAISLFRSFVFSPGVMARRQDEITPSEKTK